MMCCVAVADVEVVSAEPCGRWLMGPAAGKPPALTPAQRKALVVDEWDFASPHAITQEYVDNLTSVVSLL